MTSTGRTSARRQIIDPAAQLAGGVLVARHLGGQVRRRRPRAGGSARCRLGLGEPEPRQAGQHAALVGDLRSAGRRRTPTAGPRRRAAAGPPRARRGRGPCRSGRTSRRSSSTGDIGLCCLQAVESGDDGGDVARGTAASSKQASRSVGRERWRPPSGRPPAGRAAGGARRPPAARRAGRSRRRPRARARRRSTSATSTRLLACRPRPALDVLAHPLGRTTRPVDEARSTGRACSRAGSSRRAGPRARPTSG